VGDEPLGEWFHIVGLLLPLYAPRALEVEMFGPDAASLATAAPIADAFEVRPGRRGGAGFDCFDGSKPLVCRLGCWNALSQLTAH